MDNRDKVVVACPKCGQKLRCEAGGVGTCPKCGERISFSTQNKDVPLLNYNERQDDTTITYECPHCGNIQHEKSEKCNKCNKSMRRSFHLSIGHIIAIAVSIFFCVGGIRSDSSFSFVIGFFGIFMSVIFIISGIARNGKFIIHDTTKSNRYLPFARFSGCVGISEFDKLDSGDVLLDKANRCFIIKNYTKKIDRILSFNQIREFDLEHESVIKDKSVIGRSIAGALIAGPIGSVVGAISGLGTTTDIKYLLRIVYVPKRLSRDERTVILHIDSFDPNFYSESRILLGFDPPKRIEGEVKQTDYL